MFFHGGIIEDVRTLVVTLLVCETKALSNYMGVHHAVPCEALDKMVLLETPL